VHEQLRVGFELEELHAEGTCEVNALLIKRTIAAAAFLVATSLALSSSADDPIVPATLSMKVYRFGVSESPTCENLKIFTIDAPTFVDFSTNPALGSATIPNGTYQCVAFEVDQVIKGVAKSGSGTCGGEIPPVDLCDALEAIAMNPGSSSGNNETPSGPDSGVAEASDGGDADSGAPVEAGPENLIDGVQPLGGDASQVFKTCKPGGEHVVIYLTTQVSPGTLSNALRAPTSTSDKRHGHPLGAPLVIGDRTTGTLVTEITATSYSNGCFLGNPSFTFESSN
jgi:hypothetical protein